MKLKYYLEELDWHIIILAYIIFTLGILFIRSATQAGAEFAGQAERQAFSIIPATVVLVAALAFPYLKLRDWAFWIYIICVFMLILLPFMGVSINNARRWLALGPIRFQPSEFMKIGFLLMVSRWLKPRTVPNTWQGLVVPGIITLIPMIFIVKEPDLSSAMVFIPVLFGVCYVAGAKPRVLLMVLLGGMVLFAGIYLAGGLKVYQIDRIQAWWNQTNMPKEMRLGAGYHLRQSLIAIGSGGITGMGYMQGLQNIYDFLPYRSTDFIFSVIAEETGFIGCIFFLFLYSLFVWLCFGIAIRTRERFGRLLATGISIFFATQLFVHVAVCSGLMPPTGLTLPFVSYGRSSLITSFIFLGILLNIGMRKVRVITSDGY